MATEGRVVGYYSGVFHLNKELILETGMVHTRRPKLKAGPVSRGLLASSEARLDLGGRIACLGRKRWGFLPALMTVCFLPVTGGGKGSEMSVL